MKALFLGLGSIGTRHLRNLTAVAQERGMALEAYALRSSQRALPDDVAALLAGQYYTPDQADGHYDVVFITNPTNLHFETIRRFAGQAEALFIEKPIFENADYDLAACGLEGKTAYVACPMRHSETFRQLKKAAGEADVYSARLICSSYLPEWRPGADYRTVYSAHKEMGGGVSIDLIHEWDYLIALFGFPLECYNLQGKFSHLEISSEDLSIYIARYNHLLVELHLDYFGRGYRRTCELLTKDGTITADFGRRCVTLADGTVVDCAEDTNQWYLHEMRYFLDYAAGKAANMNSPQQALDAMKIALGQPVAGGELL